MKYNLTLTFNTDNPEELYKIIKCEAGKKDRSEIKIKKEKNKIIFDISANDSIALKSSMNLALKILTIHEKTENLIKNG